MVQVSIHSSQIGIGVWHWRLPKIGKPFPNHLTSKCNHSQQHHPYVSYSTILPLNFIWCAWFNFPSLQLGWQHLLQSTLIRHTPSAGELGVTVIAITIAPGVSRKKCGIASVCNTSQSCSDPYAHTVHFSLFHEYIFAEAWKGWDDRFQTHFAIKSLL